MPKLSWATLLSRHPAAHLIMAIADDGEDAARLLARLFEGMALAGGWEALKGPTSNFADSNDGFFLGLQSQWAIFDGRATHGRVVQAKSVLEQSRLQLTEAQLSAEVEVRTAYSTFQEATELADASQKVVGQAEEAVRLATARYDAGTATQLDVLQSQVDLTTARTNQLQSYYQYNVAVASMRKAIGQAAARRSHRQLASLDDEFHHRTGLDGHGLGDGFGNRQDDRTTGLTQGCGTRHD